MKLVDFQIVVNITWTDPARKNLSNEQIVTQRPVNRKSYLTLDDEGDYTCTALMFVDEALIKETEATIEFIQRKIPCLY